MYKRNFINLKKFIKKYWIITFCIGIIAYFVGIVLINIKGKMWYNIDIYSDSFIVKLMADNITLFPSEWTFGNQYYIIATPVIGAIICKFIDNSFYSLAIASCIMTVLTFLSYIWCMKPFLYKKTLVVGLFALSGAIIFGISASNYEYGFQIFYTMASYYSCYVIGVLLTMGLFLRLYKTGNMNKIYLIIVIFINFTLGMQSLRETLILNIPMIISSLYLLTFNRKNSKKTLFFSINMLLYNVAGIIFMNILIKLINIKTNSTISNLEIRSDVHILLKHLQFEIKNLKVITGLYFVKDIYYDKLLAIIFIGAVFVMLCVVLSIVTIIIKKDTSPIALIVIFCFISVFLVFTFGVLFFLNREIYYFIWYLTANFSICYCLKSMKNKKILKIFFLSFLIFLGLINYYSNFYLDFQTNYYEKDEFYSKVTQEILDDGIKYVYLYDWDSSYPIYAYSNNKIEMCSFILDENDGFICSLDYLKSDNWFHQEKLDKSYIIFTDKTINRIINEGNEKKLKKLVSKLQLVRNENYYGKYFNENMIIYKVNENIFVN